MLTIELAVLLPIAAKLVLGTAGFTCTPGTL